MKVEPKLFNFLQYMEKNTKQIIIWIIKEEDATV